MPKPPDLTSLDFYPWGYIKSNVYKTKVEDIRELKKKIEKEIKAIKMKQPLQNDILKLLKFFIDVNGNTFQQFISNIFISNETSNISFSNKEKFNEFR